MIIIFTSQAFLDWAQEQQNGTFARCERTQSGCSIWIYAVWIVSTEQLLDWVMDPKPISQLDSSTALKCSTPSISDKICNGMPANEAGLTQRCAFPDSPFDTCVSGVHLSGWGTVAYALLSMDAPRSAPRWTTPTPRSPLRPASRSGSAVRTHSLQGYACLTPPLLVPANCSTPFWDPVAGKCLCDDDSCAFTDDSRPIGVSFSYMPCLLELTMFWCYVAQRC